ncbi:MAG: hypothetical protein V3T92_07320 [Anaerolineae bacterium]
MCCEPESHHGGWHWGHHHGGFCACGGPFRFGPRFWTKEEKIAWLEQYLEGLREEAQAVEERIAKLKGEE